MITRKTCIYIYIYIYIDKSFFSCSYITYFYTYECVYTLSISMYIKDIYHKWLYIYYFHLASATFEDSLCYGY